MSDLVATIADDINAGTLISSFTDLVPYLVVIVPVALGIYSVNVETNCYTVRN